MADLFSHMTGQTAQVILKLLNSIAFVIYAFFKIVTHSLSYGPPQVLGVAGDVLDKY